MLVERLAGTGCTTCDTNGTVPAPYDGEPIPCTDCGGAGHFTMMNGSVRVGGKVYPSIYAAQHRFRQARGATKNLFQKALCTVVLLELAKAET